MKLKWLPIETAPNDGTEIILWSSRQIYIGSFSIEFGFKQLDTKNIVGRLTLDNMPTHWIHIPEFEGEESEYCEWTTTEEDYNLTCSGSENEDFDITPDKYKYCPVCGKHIKWSEND